MEFETTVERCGRIHIVKNGVESAEYVRYSKTQQRWCLYASHCIGDYDHPSVPLTIIAEGMGKWYTVGEAADRLVELGAFDEPPSTQMVSRWCRGGLLPGAVKVPTQGSGGSWRIPARALVAFAEGRKGQ